MKKYLKDTEATERFGAELWTLLPPALLSTRCLVFLQGDLGAGKTTVVRGFLREAGFTGAVKSPTYNLVEEYQIGDRKIVHFDLYRLADPEELEWIGINDYFDQACVCFIEWPDKGEGFLPEPNSVITLNSEGTGRVVEMKIML